MNVQRRLALIENLERYILPHKLTFSDPDIDTFLQVHDMERMADAPIPFAAATCRSFAMTESVVRLVACGALRMMLDGNVVLIGVGSDGRIALRKAGLA